MKTMKLMRTLTTAIVTLLFPVLFACSSDEKTTQGTAGSTVNPQIRSSLDSTIRILPETPTVLTDLQVSMSGLQRATYQWERNGKIILGENGDRHSKQLFAKDDTIKVSAIDGSIAISASVNIANSRPKIASVSFNSQKIMRGMDIIATPVGYDADGDFIRFNYRWLINDQEVAERDATLRGDAFRRGDAVVLEVVAYDNEGEGEVTRTVPLVIANGPPKFVSLSLTERSANTYTYTVLAEDPDGDAITYALSNPPKGMTIDANSGKITWQIIAKEDAGKREVEIVAQDDQGLKTAQKFTMEVSIPEEGKK